jgi:hypothetical protein
MYAALSNHSRFLCTPRVSKHRLFVWLKFPTLADSATFVFARSDDYFFGVLHSRLHEVWARAQGTQVRERESGFRYTPTTCFETFPFPEPTPEQGEVIAGRRGNLMSCASVGSTRPNGRARRCWNFPARSTGRGRVMCMRRTRAASALSVIPDSCFWMRRARGCWQSARSPISTTGDRPGSTSRTVDWMRPSRGLRLGRLPHGRRDSLASSHTQPSTQPQRQRDVVHVRAGTSPAPTMRRSAFSVLLPLRTVAVHIWGAAKVFYSWRLVCGSGGAKYER